MKYIVPVFVEVLPRPDNATRRDIGVWGVDNYSNCSHCNTFCSGTRVGTLLPIAAVTRPAASAQISATFSRIPEKLKTDIQITCPYMPNHVIFFHHLSFNKLEFFPFVICTSTGRQASSKLNRYRSACAAATRGGRGRSRSSPVGEWSRTSPAADPKPLTEVLS